MLALSLLGARWACTIAAIGTKWASEQSQAGGTAVTVSVLP